MRMCAQARAFYREIHVDGAEHLEARCQWGTAGAKCGWDFSDGRTGRWLV